MQILSRTETVNPADRVEETGFKLAACEVVVQLGVPSEVVAACP